jgi:hypothetical protein
VRRVSLKGFAGLLFSQAGIAAFFAFVPTGGSADKTRALQLALALGAAGVGFYVRADGVHSREAVLGFEALAALGGVFGLMQHVYLPGTIIAISVLARCASLPRFVAAPPAGQQQPQHQPDQWQTPGYEATRWQGGGYQNPPQQPGPYQQQPGPYQQQPGPYQAAQYQPAPPYGGPPPAGPAAPAGLADFWGGSLPQPQPSAPGPAPMSSDPDAAFAPRPTGPASP